MYYVISVIVACVIGALAWNLMHQQPTMTVGCITHGAVLHSSTSRDQLYLRVWCTKDGKVVP